MILRVKEETYTGGELKLPYELSLTADQPYAEKAVQLLALFVPLCRVSYEKSGGMICAELTDRYEDQPERYHLKIGDGCVKMEYSAYIGLRNALSAFSMLAKATEEGLVLPEGEIEDYPDASYRGVLIDLARGIKSFDKLKRDVIMIGRARMNVLHLHLADSQGICFHAETLPEEMCIPNAYTKEQMRELNQLAKLLALEVIPAFDVPAHANKLLTVFPELKCRVPGKEPEKVSPWVVCAGAEEAYELLEKVIAEIMELFPGEYFHMGGDELEFADFPSGKSVCHWDECERCKALKEREGLKDQLDVYYYFVKRIYKMVTDAGRRLMMFSDQVDCKRTDVLPKDILMHFWRVAAVGRGPYEGCSMNGQLEMGYTLVNSYYDETYCDNEYCMQPRVFQYWDWRKSPASDPKYADQLLGSELCVWEYGDGDYCGHYEWTLPSSVYLMADKLWSGSFVPYDREYSKMLTRAVLGPGTPEKLDLFHCFGELMPPRGDVTIYALKTPAGAIEIREAVELLKHETRCAGGDAERAHVYLKSMEKLYHWFDHSYVIED